MGVRVTRSAQVFSWLRDAIVSGELRPGERHSIYELAERLGVSRTPVRDAVLRLADSGLLEIERNRGVRIRGLTVDDIRGIFELRLMVEVPAAALAAHEADENVIRSLEESLVAMEAALEAAEPDTFFEHDRRLHDTLVDALGSSRARRTVDQLRESTGIMGVSTLGGSRSMEDIRLEHVPVVEAVRDRDGHAAAEAMAHHLVHTATLLMEQTAARGGGPGSSPVAWCHSGCFLRVVVRR